MSSEEDNYTESIPEIPEELSSFLSNEDFTEVTIFLQRSQLEDTSRYKTLLSYSYKTLVKSSHFIQSLDLMVSFPDLFEIGLPNDIIIKKYFKIVKEGNIQDLEKMILIYGFYPNIVSTDNMDLFSEAVYSNQFYMLKYLREGLGVENNEEHNMNKAARNGNKSMLKYLYEEVGIESTNYDVLIRCAVESKAVECVKYIRYNMFITKISDYKIIESAIHSAVMNNSAEMLDFLINYFTIEFEPAYIPPFRRSNLKNTSLYSSLLRLVQRNDISMLNYLIHVIKIELFTDNPEGERNCYLEFLQIAVNKGNFDILRFLIEDGQIQPSLLPKVSQDELMVTVINSKNENRDKKKMLEFLKNYDQNPGYEILIRDLEEEEQENVNEGPYKKIKIEGQSER